MGPKEDLVLFDRSKFQETLSNILRQHDASIGINWDVLKDHLYETARIVKDENE